MINRRNKITKLLTAITTIKATLENSLSSLRRLKAPTLGSFLEKREKDSETHEADPLGSSGGPLPPPRESLEGYPLPPYHANEILDQF